MLTNLITPHEYPGKLFAVEGIDGSGKRTQLALLAKWLSAAGQPMTFSPPALAPLRNNRLLH